MERVMSATQARINFGEVMRQVVEKQESIIIERAGKPQVVIVSLADYERLKQGYKKHQSYALELAAQSRARIEAQLGEKTLPPAEDIIREMRDERGESLTHLP